VQALPDPPPSRVLVHITVFGDAIQQVIENKLPKSGSGAADLVAGSVEFKWTRRPVTLRFDRGRIHVTTEATARFQLLGEHVFPVRLSIAGEPIITPDYQMQLQSTTVEATASGPLDKINRRVEERLRAQVASMLDQFRLDTRPLITATYTHLATPLDFAVSGMRACAELRVVAVEAGPTVLAQGLEKDIGLVVLPSITMPCAAGNKPAAPLPLLANVAALPSGPFSVVVPIAAQYQELSRALDTTIHGRLHGFSARYPDLYLEKPEVYPSGETLIIKMMLGGSAKVAGVDTPLEGEIYFMGHPRVADNQIIIPDLELTPGSADGLVKMKVLLDGSRLRDQARRALHVDISERLQRVKDKLSKEMTLHQGKSCIRGEVLRSAVTGIYPHQSFLRVYVTVDAQASIYVPCKR
jgi:hypothetical protein